jgi:hypothetical protein
LTPLAADPQCYAKRQAWKAKVRDTDYATEIKTVQDAQGQTIERIHVKEFDQPEIRFSW